MSQQQPFSTDRLKSSLSQAAGAGKCIAIVYGVLFAGGMGLSPLLWIGSCIVGNTSNPYGPPPMNGQPMGHGGYAMPADPYGPMSGYVPSSGFLPASSYDSHTFELRTGMDIDAGYVRPGSVMGDDWQAPSDGYYDRDGYYDMDDSAWDSSTYDY